MDSMTKRINRISGQLRGIQKMAEEGRDGIEILQQISAVKKAINGLTKEIVMHTLSGSVPPNERKNIEEMFERAINL
jgi:DNA-binding FrmR family transcriptional regulator